MPNAGSHYTAGESDSGFLQWFGEGQSLAALSHIIAAGTIVAACLDTGFQFRDLSFLETALVILTAAGGGFLFIFSLTQIISYFVFIPSISKDGHLFSRVHGTYLIHPFTTAVILGLLALCISLGSIWAWAFWLCLFAVYVVHTATIVKRIRSEQLMAGIDGRDAGALLTVLNLVVGGEIVTVAAGAKPISPWNLRNLPENTWIVDVRTKPEFNWNRLQGAENFPWGTGVIDAAASKPKSVPVLVICFSGHRSPAVAVTLRRLGFDTVYNLNWGLLYLILLERGRMREGPFGLTRSNRSSRVKAEDFRGISVGYITFAVLTLIVAPLENAFLNIHTAFWQELLGAILGLGGLLIGVSSVRSLGENFRLFAAPKENGTLVTKGIYSRIRHPMYTATVMSLLGYVISFGSLFAIPFWAGCAILYVAKASKEEPLLMERYPEYLKYSRRTSKFIPFIW